VAAMPAIEKAVEAAQSGKIAGDRAARRARAMAGRPPRAEIDRGEAEQLNQRRGAAQMLGAKAQKGGPRRSPSGSPGPRPGGSTCVRT
jgi:hypothetical protein